MRNRLMMACLALTAVATASAAWADGSGEVACEMNLQHVNTDVNRQAHRLPPPVLQQLRQRLDVAESRCAESNNAGETDIAEIRSILVSYRVGHSGERK